MLQRKEPQEASSRIGGEVNTRDGHVSLWKRTADVGCSHYCDNGRLQPGCSWCPSPMESHVEVSNLVRLLEV